MESLRDLIVRMALHFDPSQFKKADKATNDLASTTQKLAKIMAGALAGYAMIQLVNQTTGMIDKLDEAAEAYGLNVAQLQRLGYAAQRAGVDQGQLQQALGIMTRQAGDASTGSDEAAKKFAQLGISVVGAGGELKSTQSLFMEAADAIAGIDNPARRTAMAMEIFGRGGAKMIPMLSKGSKGLEEMGIRFDDLGGAASEDFVKASVEYQDALDDTGVALNGLKFVLVGAILPAFRFMVGAITTAISWFRKMQQGTEIIRVGLVVLTAVAAYFGRTMLAAWVKSLAMPLLIAAGVLALILIVEDLYQLFTGGKSLIGDLIRQATEWINLFIDNPKANDSWFIKTLRSALATIREIYRVSTKLLGSTKIEEVMGEPIESRGAGGMPLTPAETAEQGRALDYKRAMMAEMGNSSMWSRLTGSAESDAASRLSSRGIMAPSAGSVATPYIDNNPRYTTEIQIVAGVGMDEKALAQSVGQRVREELESHNQDAVHALTPGVVAP